MVLRLDGALDRAALADAFDTIVARHESLRTGFAEQDGMPVQVIHAGGAWCLPSRRVWTQA